MIEEAKDKISIIKIGGLHALKIVFNDRIHKVTTHDQWTNAIILLIHQKGDITNAGNYRLISLLGLSDFKYKPEEEPKHKMLWRH